MLEIHHSGREPAVVLEVLLIVAILVVVVATFTFHLPLGFVHSLQDVALHQCLPLSSI